MNAIELDHELAQIGEKFVTRDELERLQTHVKALLNEAGSNSHSTIQSQSLEDDNHRGEFDTQWQENFDYFNTHKEDLAKEYPDQYVAINGLKVIACKPTLRELSIHVFDTFGHIPVYAGFTGEQKAEILELPFEYCR